MKKIFIDGSAGTTGLRIHERLGKREEFEILTLTEEKRKDIVEKINQVLIDAWGCPQEAISISLEEVTPENWDAQVKVPEMDARDETMYILHGEKRF
jgi:phenylpyruvate tautomerase PptA (4-oxalocrotonate tautomerase family)